MPDALFERSVALWYGVAKPTSGQLDAYFFELSGLITCGCCEGAYALRRADRFACSNHVGKGTCDNSRTIPREDLERRVFAA